MVTVIINWETPFGERIGEGSAKPRESQAVGARGLDWSGGQAVSSGSGGYLTGGMRLSPYRTLPPSRGSGSLIWGYAYITYQNCQRDNNHFYISCC